MALDDVRRVYVNVEPGEDAPFCFVERDPEVWQPAASRVGATEARQYTRDKGFPGDIEWVSSTAVGVVAPQ